MVPQVLTILCMFEIMATPLTTMMKSSNGELGKLKCRIKCWHSSSHPVYVGKSRRMYLEMSGSGEADEPMVVGCEVVLFEHLLSLDAGEC